MLLKTWYKVFLFLIICPAVCNAQTVKAYLESDGLPDRYVIGGVQDCNGLIWFATKGGLSRFDGYKFENFTTNTLPTLSSNTINSIAANEQYIFVCSENGVDRLRLADYKIETLRIDERNGSGYKVETYGKEVFVLTSSGKILRLDGDSLVSFVAEEDEVLFKEASELLVSKDLLLVQTKHSGVYLLNRSGKILGCISYDDQEIYEEIFMRDSILYASGGGTLKSANISDSLFNSTSTEEDEVHNFFIDYKGDEWLVSRERKELKLKVHGRYRVVSFSTG